MIQPLAASPEPRSEASAALPDDLICPAAEIFDPVAVAADLMAALAEASDAMAVRKAVVEILGKARSRGAAAIEAAFRAEPFGARPTTRAYCWLTDQIVKTVLDICHTRLHPLATPTEGERLAVIAVGGYGRGEMAPFSDVDLLFLTPYKQTAWGESVIASMLYILWDLKLKVGHAARSVEDCIRLAASDMTIRTVLLEKRA